MQSEQQCLLCRFMLGEQLGPQLAGTAVAGQALQERLACLVSARVLGCLAPVMSRARLLAPNEQVPLVPADQSMNHSGFNSNCVAYL